MRKENAIFAGEMTAIITFAKTFTPTTGHSFLLLMEHLSRATNHFPKFMRPYMEGHFMSGELNYRVETFKSDCRGQQRFAKDGKEDFTDGYSLKAMTGAQHTSSNRTLLR